MNPIKFTFLFLIFILSKTVFSQTPALQHLTQSNYMELAQHQVVTLRDSLHLDSLQTINVKGIFTELTYDLAMLQNDSIKFSARKDKIQSLLNIEDIKLKATLTEEQYEKYKTLIDRKRTIVH